MKLIKQHTLFITVLFLGLSHQWMAMASLTAREIVMENERSKQISGIQFRATLTTGGGESATKTKKFRWWRKIQADQVHFKTLVKFDQPIDIQGEGILFLEHSDRTEILMYLPRFKKTRRVESQQQSQSFMGSELSYSDIATPHVDDFHHRLIKETSCPTPDTVSVKCYVIESTPISEAIRNRTGYSKLIQWIRTDPFIDIKIEYYDKDGNLYKQIESSEIKMIDPNHKKWMANKVRIDNLKTHRYTLFSIENVQLITHLNEFIFSMQNLSRER